LPSDRFNWRDLLAIVSSSPRTSALFRARNPEAAGWDANTYALANVIDLLQGVQHVMLRALGARPKRPKPYPRPGVVPEGVTRIASKPVPLAQLRKRLGRNKTT
jgi:hypothetical protein